MARPNTEDRRARAKIAAGLGSADFALPGTVLERRISGGKLGCC